MTNGSPRTVNCAAALYRLLLKGYPAEFRREYGDEMLHVFRELASESWNRKGTAGLMSFWLRVLADLVRSVPQQHFLTLSGRFSVKTILSASLAVAVAAFLQLVVFTTLALLIGSVAVCGAFMGIVYFEGFVAGQKTPLPVELAIVLLPPIVTGFILARVRPFHRSLLAAPLGTMLLWGPASIFAGGSPWWGGVGLMIVTGALAWGGCFASSRVQQRPATS
jgi:hypothetical protein